MPEFIEVFKPFFSAFFVNWKQSQNKLILCIAENISLTVGLKGNE